VIISASYIFFQSCSAPEGEIEGEGEGDGEDEAPEAAVGEAEAAGAGESIFLVLRHDGEAAAGLVALDAAHDGLLAALPLPTRPVVVGKVPVVVAAVALVTVLLPLVVVDVAGVTGVPLTSDVRGGVGIGLADEMNEVVDGEAGVLMEEEAVVDDDGVEGRGFEKEVVVAVDDGDDEAAAPPAVVVDAADDVRLGDDAERDVMAGDVPERACSCCSRCAFMAFISASLVRQSDCALIVYSCCR
jgi:hypothetical protein